jgi:D-sedoheptulose 7-phosphate isomerase
MTFTEQYLDEVVRVAMALEGSIFYAIEKMVDILAVTRLRGGRLFILGVGGSAANASHAVNDFRKICGFEAYAATDNVAELTARTNDEGWETVFEAWLKGSRLGERDAVLILSVGGGNVEKKISVNLVRAIDYARSVGSQILGVVGRDGGYTAKMADACVLVPVVNDERVTPHTEAFQAVVWHLLVSHPTLKQNRTKWESI